MTIINVMVDDQRLEFSSMPVVASEGVKETYVKFALSSDWSGFGATALFYRDDSPEDVYTSVLDGAGLAEVPYEITAAPGWIRFGLSGSDGTSVHTSEILKYKIVKGKYTSGQSSEPPAPGIYEQMLAIAGQMRDTLNAAVIEQNAIIQGLVSDMTDLRSDMETEQTTFESVVTGQINTLVNNFAGSSRETILFEGSHTVNIGDEIDLVSDPTVYDYLDIVLNDGMVGTIIGPTQNSQWRVTGETVKSTGTSVTTYVIEGVLDAQSLCLRVSTACAIVDTGTASTRYDLGSGPIADESLRRYCLKVIGRKLTDDAEVLNIRVGADGVTYQTAGTAVRSQLDKKLNSPISGGTVDYGTSGQLLATDGQGNTEWVDSTVEDGSITLAKLAPGVIDTTYQIQGAAAESVKTGRELALKANANDVTALDTRVTWVETEVEGLIYDDKTITGTGEILDEFARLTSVSVSEATSAVVRSAQIFEARYPGTTSQYGVSVTKNDDGTYTIDGLATSSPWFHLNQDTRTGADNPVSLDGTYTFVCEVVSGSWTNVTYEGATSGYGAIKSTGGTTYAPLTLGDVGKQTVELSNISAVIGFRITNGVRYDALKIKLSLNKGEDDYSSAQYVAPTTISDFSTILTTARTCLPYLWIQTTPDTASITAVGKIEKSEDGGGGGDEPVITDRYGVLEKYTDRVDFLTQMFTKPLFLIYTDIHGNEDNLKRIQTWYEGNKKNYVSDVYCLGDMVRDQATDSLDQFDVTTIWAKTLKVIGNHDVLVGTSLPGITAEEAYAKYIAPNVASWGVTQPTNPAVNGKNYYYKDYNSKIRVIVLDTYFYTQDQHNWFVSILADARTSGLAVIVAQHEDICTSAEKRPLNADYPFAKKHNGYTNLQYRTYGDGGDYQTKRSAVDAFIGAGGIFICWLCGHQHADMTGTYDGGEHGKQLSVLLSNASNSMTSSIRINDYCQDCFTYLGVDTDAGYIYLLRIGITVDKWMHRNLYLVYDYINHSVIEYN